MNINDYLIWRGDLPLDEYEFNVIDSLILARVSYLPFEKIDFKDGDSFEVVSKKMKGIKEYKIDDDEYLIMNLGNSTRFKDLILTDYIINKDRELERQFGAITIHLPDCVYVSYIGTDNSIVGWKEDFNMSFMKHIPAQIEGVKYLNRAGHKYDNIRVGGHSKGGNVAIYSSLYCNKETSDKIISVDNFDGPGFDNDVILESSNTNLLNRITTYIPQDSVIGRLLEHKEKFVIIKSNYKGIKQHDVYSWEIIKDRFVNDSITDSSEFVNQSIKQWLLNTDVKSREIFVDSIFDLFYSSKSDSFRQLSKNWINDIPNMLGAYKDISKDDKKVVGEMIKEFGKASSVVFKKESKEKFESLNANFSK